MGYSPWSCKESDTSERISLSLFSLLLCPTKESAICEDTEAASAQGRRPREFRLCWGCPSLTERISWFGRHWQTTQKNQVLLLSIPLAAPFVYCCLKSLCAQSQQGSWGFFVPSNLPLGWAFLLPGMNQGLAVLTLNLALKPGVFCRNPLMFQL